MLVKNAIMIYYGSSISMNPLIYSNWHQRYPNTRVKRKRLLRD